MLSILLNQKRYQVKEKTTTKLANSVVVSYDNIITDVIAKYNGFKQLLLVEYILIEG